MSALDTASIMYSDNRARSRMQNAAAARVSTRISKLDYPEGQVVLSDLLRRSKREREREREMQDPSSDILENCIKIALR